MDDDLLKLENQLCFAVVTAARNVVVVYRPVLEPLGLTHPQYLVMLALWESSPRSLGELAEELAMEPATLSPLVKRLEAQGRVSRARRADDERVLESSSPSRVVRCAREALEVPRQIMERVGMDAAEIGRAARRAGAVRAAAPEPAPVTLSVAKSVSVPLQADELSSHVVGNCAAFAHRLAIRCSAARPMSRAAAPSPIGPITEDASCDLGHTRGHTPTSPHSHRRRLAVGAAATVFASAPVRSSCTRRARG